MATDRRRWLALIAALYAAGASGASYAYSVYSGALKAQFHLRQSDVDTIGLIGQLVSLGSFALGALANRWGPKLSTMVGGVIMSSGYAGQWVVAHWYPNIHSSEAVVIFSILTCVGSIGSGLITGSVFATSLRNFPSPSVR